MPFIVEFRNSGSGSRDLPFGFRRRLLAGEFRLEGDAQARQVAMAADLLQSRFDLQQGRRQPAVLLLRVPPAVHLVGAVADE